MSRLKKSFSVFLYILICYVNFPDKSIAQASQPPIIQGQFLGVNDTDPSVSIGNQAQSALNVETSLNGSALRKRDGYVRTGSLPVSTSPATGVFSFIDTSGNKQLVVCSDHYCSKSTNGGAFTTFLSTAGGSCMPTRWSFAQNLGNLYGANDCRDPIFQYNGTTFIGLSTGAPAGTILEATKDRLVVSGVSGQPSAVYYSQSGVFNNFIIGLLSASSYTDYIGANGDQVRALKYALGRLFIFKTNSITTCILGDQYTSKCYPVSNTIGTIDPNGIVEVPAYSVQGDSSGSGALLFRGSDNNFWRLDGGGLVPISKKILTLIKSQNSGSTQSNTQNTQSQWEAGNVNAGGVGAPVSTKISPGSVRNSSYTILDDWVASTNGIFSTGTNSGAGVSVFLSTTGVSLNAISPLWTANYTPTVIPESAIPPWSDQFGIGDSFTESVAGGTLTIHNQFPGVTAFLYRTFPSALNANHVFHLIYNNDGNSDTFSANFTDGTNQFGFLTFGVSAGNNVLYQSGTEAQGASVGEHVSGWNTYTVVVTTPNFSAYYYRNGVFKSSTTGNWGTNPSPPNRINLGIRSTGPLYFNSIAYSNVVSTPSTTASLGNVTTANYFSPIFDTGYSTPIAGPFSILVSSPPGTTITFNTRSARAIAGPWSSWASATNGLKPTNLDGNEFWQWQSSFTTTISTLTPTITKAALTASTSGQYTTQCIQPGSAISSFGELNCGTTLVGNGSLIFYATAAASCALLPSSPPNSWIGGAQTNNANLGISTGAAVYIGWAALIGSATDYAQVNTCTLNWQNGSPTPPTWGTYDPFLNAVYWNVSINNSATSNRVLKYDMNLNEWYPFGLNATAIYRDQNSNSIFFGDSSAGFWNQYGNGVTSDNGAAINAFWISRDFGNPTYPFVDNTYSRISMVGKNEPAGTINVTYTFNNGNSGSYSMSISTTSTWNYVHMNQALLQASPYQFMKVNIGNNSTNAFEIDALAIDYTSFGWQPQNP